MSSKRPEKGEENGQIQRDPAIASDGGESEKYCLFVQMRHIDSAGDSKVIIRTRCGQR